MKLDDFFGLFLSLWCKIRLNSVIVVEKWHHSRLNRSPVVPFLPWYAMTRVLKKNEKSVTLSVLSVLIRFLATDDVGMSWLAHCALTRQQHCLQATPSVSSNSSCDGLVYCAATFPATVWSQFKLDLKERETTNEIKCEPALMAAANVNILARLQKLPAATSNERKKAHL